MSKHLLITSLCYPQVAVMQGDKLCRLLSDSECGQAGDIYLAKVVRVLPTLGVAFLDIGEQKNVLLSLNKTTVIQGQMLIVQLTCSAHNQKGATVTTAISLSLPYVVYKPYGKGVGVSGKTSKSVATTLKQTALDIAHELSIKGGFVVRTSAKDVDLSLLKAHMAYLSDVWRGILADKSTAKIPSRLYRTPLTLVALSDHADLTAIHTDDGIMYDKWAGFAKRYLPQLAVFYHRPSLFDKHDVYTKLQNALDSRVNLPLGAYLIIDECEAMTVIDVNTGTLVASSQDIVYQANLEAVKAIAGELMLRQIGGLVVVDLIDMKNKKQKELVYQAFKKALADDIAKVHLSFVNEFGLIELSRERVSPSFSAMYAHHCLACHGTGKIKTLQTMRLAIIAKLTSLSADFHTKDEIVLRISEKLHDFLVNDEHFQQVSAVLGSVFRVKIMAEYADDKYDILQNKYR
ncbi:MAG: ribonuclease E/G [Moraxella sp.]|nr:ribonuclease E/G [Moraxella sp.]